MISFYSRSTKFSTKKAPQDHNKRRVMSFRSSTSRRFRATSGNEWFGGRCPDRRTGKPGFLPPGNSWVSIAVLFCLNREKKNGQLWHGFWMEDEVNNNFGWQNGDVKQNSPKKRSKSVGILCPHGGFFQAWSTPAKFDDGLEHDPESMSCV